MFAEDRAAFFEDFGIVAQARGKRALVLLDAPDRDALSGRVTSTQYAMTFDADSFPDITHGDSVRIGETNYSVISVNNLDDGAFRVATLQRV